MPTLSPALVAPAVALPPPLAWPCSHLPFPCCSAPAIASLPPGRAPRLQPNPALASLPTAAASLHRHHLLGPFPPTPAPSLPSAATTPTFPSLPPRCPTSLTAAPPSPSPTATSSTTSLTPPPPTGEERLELTYPRPRRPRLQPGLARTSPSSTALPPPSPPLPLAAPPASSWPHPRLPAHRRCKPPSPPPPRPLPPYPRSFAALHSHHPYLSLRTSPLPYLPRRCPSLSLLYCHLLHHLPDSTPTHRQGATRAPAVPRASEVEEVKPDATGGGVCEEGEG